MLEVSSNQIYSETYKALRSIDIDWGIAKDSANLCKWLATHNQFFLGSISAMKVIALFLIIIGQLNPQGSGWCI